MVMIGCFYYLKVLPNSKYWLFFYLEQFSRTVNGIVNSLSDNKRKEKPSSKRVQELSSHQLNHVVTVIENWKQDEEGLQVSDLFSRSQLSGSDLGVQRYAKKRIAIWKTRIAIHIAIRLVSLFLSIRLTAPSSVL